MGARSMGMGNASSCLQDEWSVLNNPAGLSEVKNYSASFSYHAYPALKAFNRMAATFAAPLKFGVAGVGVFKFGDNLYSEQVISAVFSNRFGLASLGAKINYIQYHAEGFGNAGAVTVSLGGIATLTPRLQVGAHVININQPKISVTGEGETVPTRLIAGLAFKPSEKFLLSTEIEKELTHKSMWKAGTEYAFHKKFIARTGVNINPDAGFAGFGFRSKKFMLDYAITYHVNIGLHHQAAVSYKILTR